MTDRLLSLARLFLSTNQASKPKTFDLKDLGYTLKLAAVVFVAAGSIAGLGVLDAFDYGMADVAVSTGIAWLVAAVEAWQADNS